MSVIQATTAPAVDLTGFAAASGHLTLVRVGATTFTPTPVIEGITLIEDPDAVDAAGDPIWNVAICVWLGGKSGTNNVGMTTLIVDTTDEVAVYRHL